MKPGELFVNEGAGDIEANGGRSTISLLVQHTGDRPIQVGSHIHFFEVNRALRFDRNAAYGMRLNIPSGLAVRFEPGDAKEVPLVALAGDRMAFGASGLVQGRLDDLEVQQAAFVRLTDFNNDSD